MVNLIISSIILNAKHGWAPIGSDGEHTIQRLIVHAHPLNIKKWKWKTTRPHSPRLKLLYPFHPIFLYQSIPMPRARVICWLFIEPLKSKQEMHSEFTYIIKGYFLCQTFELASGSNQPGSLIPIIYMHWSTPILSAWWSHIFISTTRMPVPMVSSLGCR